MTLMSGGEGGKRWMDSMRAFMELFGKDPSRVVELQSPELCRLLALPRALQLPQLPMPAPWLLPVLGPRVLATRSKRWHREPGHLTSGD